MQSMIEGQSSTWQPCLSDTPRTLRIVPVTGADAVNWTTIAVRCVSEPEHEDFAKGVEVGMSVIKSELFLPLSEELPVQRLLSCFSTATANGRVAKLSQILHLVHRYPGAPLVHKGLRFVTASLWASYAALKLEGEEGRLQSAKINSEASLVWTALGWKATSV